MSSQIPSSPLLQDIKISAILPTYNRGRTIARAVQSILDQSLAPLEIIVVDDGSTDDTRARLGALDNAAVRYVHQPNAGASAARNRGVNEAIGDWIAFLDSDDIWVPTHLQRIATAITKTEGKASFYFADMERPVELGGGSHWDHVGFSAKDEHEFTNDASEWVALSWQPMMLQTSVFNRSKYLECGGLMNSIKVRHDNHIFLNLGLAGPACAVPGYGTRQTYDGGSADHLAAVSGSHTPDFWNDTVLLYTDILQRKTNLQKRHRDIFRNRLALAYWRLSRFAWRDKMALPFFRNFLRCFLADPAFLAGLTKP